MPNEIRVLNVIKDLVANVKRVEFYKELVPNVIVGHKCNKGKVTNVTKSGSCLNVIRVAFVSPSSHK